MLVFQHVAVRERQKRAKVCEPSPPPPKKGQFRKLGAFYFLSLGAKKLTAVFVMSGRICQPNRVEASHCTNFYENFVFMYFCKFFGEISGYIKILQE
jgi:hypothetical protein